MVNPIHLCSKSREKNISPSSASPIEELARQGARILIQSALEVEIQEFLEKNAHRRDELGHQSVVRNGYLPEREIVTGIGPLSLKQPRARDKKGEVSFNSQILPPFIRRFPSVDALIPWLYLKGVATSDFSEALSAILGPNAKGLSAANVVRLKEVWEKEFEDWNRRSLADKHYVYWWADGIYFNVRLTEDRPCVLVLMGALEDGTKEIITIVDGERESKLSWQNLLTGLKSRGLKMPAKVAVGDGALGFWAALEEVFPSVLAQRCWVHKTANILDKLPKKVQPDAKRMIFEIYMAPTEKAATKAYEDFIRLYKDKYPKAVECLTKDKEALFTFFSFPAEHWRHLRTSNPIESTFATVRHRTRQTKGCGSRMATLTMVFKLAREAEKGWRKLNGYKKLGLILRGVEFKDGIRQMKKAA